MSTWPCLPRAGLRSLNLRQNILPDAGALSGAAFAGSLQDLELRDNLLTEVRPWWSAPQPGRRLLRCAPHSACRRERGAAAASLAAARPSSSG